MMKRFVVVIIAISLLCSSGTMAAEYYASPSGSGGDGTKGNPWGPAEINWTTLNGADNTLYLFGGTWSSKFEFTHASTTYTLTIRPCSASPDPSGCDSLVVFTGIVQFGTDAGGSCNNVTIDGEKTVGACTGKALNDTTCRWIKGVQVKDRGYFATPAVNTKVKYLELTGLADETHAAYVIGLTDYQSDGLEVAYNYLHDNDGHSDIVANSTNATWGSCKIHHNYIEKGTTNFIFGPYKCDVYNNYFDTTDMSPFPAGNLYDVIHLMAGPDTYLRLYNNDFVGCAEQSVFFENAGGTGSKTTKVRIFNNVFNCKENGGLSIKGLAIENSDYVTGVDDFHIINNVFANFPAGGIAIRLYGHASGDPLTNFSIKNNIFYNNATEIGTAGGGTFPTFANDTDAILDYNLFYKSGGFTFTWANAAHDGVTDYTSVATFATDHATLTHNVGGTDPLFISSSNFRLQSSSPAIGAGQDLSSLTNMPTGWPFDKDGVSRTGTWDIGAYEYYETGNRKGITASGVSIH